MRSPDDQMGKNSRSATAAILIGAAALIAMVVGVVYAVASRIDTAARLREQRLIAKGLELTTEEVSDSLTPNTVWDEAVLRLDVKFDPAWADSFFGQNYWRTNGYPVLLIVKGDGQPVFVSIRGHPVPTERFAPFARAAAPVIADVRAKELARGPPSPTDRNPKPIGAGRIVRVGDHDYVLSASLVQSDNSSGATPSARAPIVLAGLPIDQAFLGAFTRRYLVQGLQLEPPGRRIPPGQASVPLEAAPPGAGARLAWRPDSPASHLLGLIGPFLLACFLVLAAVGVLLVRHERRRNHALLLAMREARQASEAKSAFLATVSHEIRTPLNGVLGMVQAMEHDPLSPTQRERLGVIRQSGTALLDILNNVLDLSKIEAGMMSLDEIDFCLEAIAQDARAAFAAVADSKGVALEVEVEQDAHGQYRGDPVRVRQVIYNLVANALKFTEAGSVRLALAATKEGVRISVRDTGIGIAPDRIAQLFDKFVQADSSTTRRFGGTGLGLAICRELCEAMGGAITVESELGAGSTFIVDLPLPAAASAGADEPTRAEAADDLETLAPLRVLAAEDNAINQLVLRTLLAQVGIEPILVANGADAVEAFANGPWDLVLMDVQMPVMDGVEAARRIRALEAETGAAPTPIIALTANAMDHQIRAYIEAGMDGHLAKPIEIERLFEILAGFGGGNPERDVAA